MRLTLALLTATALCLPAVGVEAQQTFTQQPSDPEATYALAGYGSRGSWDQPEMAGWDYAEAMEHPGWGGQGMGWAHPGMGWGHPGMGWGNHHRGWQQPHMSWQHPGMGWGQGRGSGQGMTFGPQGQMGGGMGPLAMLVPMMMAMADTNGDGALSAEEHQAVHSRMFNYFDSNKDGKLTPQEVQSALRGESSLQTSPPSTATSPSTTTQPSTTNQ